MSLQINKKLLFFIITIIFLILALIAISSTYARYVTALTAKSTVELGSWLIKVNDQNIMDNSDFSSKITPIFNENSEYIAEGVIAPTSTGYVVITVDYSKVTVPFQYNLTFAHEANSALKDFNLISYSIDDGELVTVDDPTAPITSTILPTDTLRTKTFKLNFEWFDGEGENFTDIDDTAFYINNSQIGLRFNLEFTQLQPTPESEPAPTPEPVPEPTP